MMLVETIFSGFVSEVISDCIGITKDKIKEAVKNRKNKHQSLESQIYNMMVDVLNELTGKKYTDQDILFDAAEKMLKGFQNKKIDDADAVRIGLRNIVERVDNATCEEFIGLVYHEISKEEHFDLYKEILLLLFNQGQNDNRKEFQQISEKLNQVTKILKQNNVNDEIKPMIDERISIFVSYSWNDRDFVDVIDNQLQTCGYKVERDIRDTDYAQSIKVFMKRIRETDYSIIVLSDSFLKSENCMREIFEFIKDDNYKNRIIPVILETAKGIWGSNKGIEYTIYWKKREEEFKEELKQIDEESKVGYIDELKHISSIKNSIGEVIGIFRDMKMFDGSNCDIVDEVVGYVSGNVKKKIP